MTKMKVNGMDGCKGGASYHLQSTSFAFPLSAVSVKKNLRCCFVTSCRCRAENQVQEDKKKMLSTEFDLGYLGEVLNTP
jgi:hypothetical protein